MDFVLGIYLEKQGLSQAPDFLAFHVTYMLTMAIVGSWIRIWFSYKDNLPFKE